MDLEKVIQEYEDIIKTLQNDNQLLKLELEKYKKRCEQYSQDYDFLMTQMRELQRRVFGKKSERFIDPESQQAEESKDCEKAEEEEVQLASYARKKKTKANKVIPTRVVIIPVPDDQKVCACGSCRVRIRYETKQLLHHQPAVFEIIEQRREVVTCPAGCPGVITAQAPLQILPKIKATEEFLSFLVVSKMDDRQPLYHLEKQLNERHGIDYSRQTLARCLLAQCQRSGRLSLYRYEGGRYLVAIDGTGYFYSEEVHCEQCCEKHHRDGRVSYYHQILAAAIVHPKQKVVLPFAPEPIMKTDGMQKNDCEHRAAERLLGDFKREHPHLKVIITGDGLYPNGPFIKRLTQDGHRFILVAREKNHQALFEEFRALPRQQHEVVESKVKHRFEWANGHVLNDSHLDCRVNVLEYWEEHANGKIQHWTWITDIELSEKNVYQIMRGGRARYRIENETFNTLKNQGYQYEHNFGHGNKYLSSVFAHMMLIVFYVDQLQQLGCKLFARALSRLYTKRSLWERQRSYFFNFYVKSIEELWMALAYGHKGGSLAFDTS